MKVPRNRKKNVQGSENQREGMASQRQGAVYAKVQRSEDHESTNSHEEKDIFENISNPLNTKPQ